jgi:thiol:disulfide interchange protein
VSGSQERERVDPARERPPFPPFRIWLLVLGGTLSGLTLALPVVDGVQKTFSNLGQQIVWHGLLFAVGAVVAIPVRNRRWAPWVLVPLLFLICAAATIVWHRTPALPE